jgi:hypothetical protein
MFHVSAAKTTFLISWLAGGGAIIDAMESDYRCGFGFRGGTMRDMGVMGWTGCF